MNGPGGYCAEHQGELHKQYNARRRSRAETDDSFYSSKRWRDVRAGHLRDEPLCRLCRITGKLTPAVVVDHIIPIKRGGPLYDHDNLQSLCWSCHSSKTRQEEQEG